MNMYPMTIKTVRAAIISAVCTLFVFTVCSCQPDPLLSVYTDTIEISNIAQTNRTSFVANGKWEAHSDSEWCEISPNSGDGAIDNIVSIDIKTTANPEKEKRSAVITVTSGDMVKTITVEQAMCDVLEIDRNRVTVPYQADSILINIHANVTYDIVLDEDCKSWMSVDEPTIHTDGVIKVHFTENIAEQREGIFRIKQYNGGITRAFTLTQETGYISIADPQFEAYCVQNFDFNNDKKISYFEAKIPTMMVVSMMEIKSFKGIEFFEALEYLYANRMSFTKLDLTNNSKMTTVECNYDKLETVDVNNLINLTSLSLDGNPLTSINVDGCTALTYLYLRQCKLNDIDLTSLSSLKTFFVQDNNLSEIDVTHNPNLANLNISGNPITEIDLTKNPKLKTLSCSNTGIKEIDLSENPNLDEVDLSSNPELKTIWLKRGQTILNFTYSQGRVSVKYKS